jgi:hypothetical protein
MGKNSRENQVHVSGTNIRLDRNQPSFSSPFNLADTGKDIAVAMSGDEDLVGPVAWSEVTGDFEERADLEQNSDEVVYQACQLGLLGFANVGNPYDSDESSWLKPSGKRR